MSRWGALATALALLSCSSSPEPRLDSVSPAEARRDRPTRVSIAGTGFLPLITVDTERGTRTVNDLFRARIGEVALDNVVRVSESEIQAVVNWPSDAPLGSADLVVVDPRGREARLPGGLTVLEADTSAPRVVFEPAPPAEALAGATVNLRVFARDPAPGLVTDIAWEADAGEPRTAQQLAEPPTAELALDVVFRMPIDAPVGSLITLTARAHDDAPQPNEGSAVIQLRVAEPPPGPQLFFMLPARGPAQGGQAVVITGAGFTQQTRIEIGGAALLSPLFESATRIRGRTPPHPVGDVDVVASDALGSATLTLGYHYGQPPLIVGLEPLVGLESGGDLVTVSGYGLDQATVVRFGMAAGSALGLIDNQTLRVTTPPGSDVVDVVLENGAGPTDRLVMGYRYLPRLTLESVRPMQGQAGRTVTLRGSGFRVGMRVYFGGALVSGVVVVSPTNLRVSAPAGLTGTVDVVVENQVSTASLTQAFTYN